MRVLETERGGGVEERERGGGGEEGEEKGEKDDQRSPRVNEEEKQKQKI